MRNWLKVLLPFLCLLCAMPCGAFAASLSAMPQTVPADTSDNNGKNASNMMNGHEYVDLGLSVMWATCDLGATSPEDSGDGYRWGETVVGTDMEKWWHDLEALNNWNISGNAKYDTARANWGGEWRMPTYSEWEELYEKCQWEETYYKWEKSNYEWKNGYEPDNHSDGKYGYYVQCGTGHSDCGYDSDGKYGYVVYDKPCGYKVSGSNGNSIFLPFSHFYFSSFSEDGFVDGDFVEDCLEAVYWSSTGLRGIAYATWVSNYNVTRYDDRHKCDARLKVRPVFTSPKQKGSQAGIVSTGKKDEMVQASARSSEASHIFRCEVGQWYSDPVPTPASRIDDNYQLMSDSMNNVTPSGTMNGHEYVDLGLSVMWATCNMGALRPSHYGEYYAWGECHRKNHYGFDNYRYEARLHYLEDDEPLAPFIDAANGWGGTWRMPTKDDWQELIEKCVWKDATQDGKDGFLVVGPNGNRIFLPAAGFWGDGDSPEHVRTDGNYWSSSFFGNMPESDPDATEWQISAIMVGDAYMLCFSCGQASVSPFSCVYGCSIRPVADVPKKGDVQAQCR